MVCKYGEQVRIYNHYTDKKRLLRIKTLCDLFNDIAELHTYQQGVNVDILNQQGLTWMLRRIHIFIADMPKREERMLFESWNPACDGLLVPRIYKVSDWNQEAAALYENGTTADKASTGALRAFAYTDWMLINLKGRRPERPTAMMKDLAGRYQECLPFTASMFDRREQKGIIGFDDPAWHEACRVQAHYRDIDFNGHVTQSSYIQWMMDAHPDQFMEKHLLEEMEVIYAHELKPGSETGIWLHEAGENRISYAVRSLDGTILHAYGRARFRSISGLADPFLPLPSC